MKASSALIAVVDDDLSIRESLPAFLSLLGYRSEVFASALEFLHSDAIDRADCLILDVTMPEMSGPQLHAELLRRGKHFPVVFATAAADPALRAELLANGATACLFKPFTDMALLEALVRSIGSA